MDHAGPPLLERRLRRARPLSNPSERRLPTESDATTVCHSALADLVRWHDCTPAPGCVKPNRRVSVTMSFHARRGDLDDTGPVPRDVGETQSRPHAVPAQPNGPGRRLVVC